MVTSSWQQKIDIKKQLLEQSSKFSFVQAIRLLELDSKSSANKKEIRVHPRLSLDFPNSDITEIKEFEAFIKLTVTFMGLYGESSPLPTFYTESLLDEELNDSSVMRDFIDIFNMPIYQTYFKVWKKNRLGIRLNEFNDRRVLDLLHSFSGMPQEHLRQKYKNHHSLLKYASLNMQFPRSAEALRILISNIIGHESVEIEQCIEQMASIPVSQHCSLGIKNTELDDNLHLGSKIKDRMGKFRISITELDIQSFNELLPGTSTFQNLVQEIGLYITKSLDWEMQLCLKNSAFQAIVLGEKQESKLGLNTWLGDQQHDPKSRTLVLGKTQYKDLKW